MGRTNKTGRSFRESRRILDSLGIMVKPNEVVHHVDGNPQNNNPNNLQIMTRGEHQKHHFGTVNEPHVHEFVSVTCPICGQTRLIQYRHTKDSNHTGRCMSCNGKVIIKENRVRRENV